MSDESSRRGGEPSTIGQVLPGPDAVPDGVIPPVPPLPLVAVSAAPPLLRRSLRRAESSRPASPSEPPQPATPPEPRPARPPQPQSEFAPAPHTPLPAPVLEAPQPAPDPDAPQPPPDLQTILALLAPEPQPVSLPERVQAVSLPERVQPASGAEPVQAVSPPLPPRAVSVPEPPHDGDLPEPPRPAPLQPPTRREERERHSFLRQERRDEPARMGMRGALNRMGFTLAPGAFEQSLRDDEQLVSQHWSGPRTIAVVNGKGGAGKTPTTALLSAVFARYGGAGVLAWDNNQTRGTLGWRTETGAHDHTLLELLPETDRLRGAGAQSADLAQFVHHQPREKYDVLRSKPIRLGLESRLNPADVDAIHAVAARFYRLIIIDSGNDESDPMWLRMIDHADQVVVATTTRSDHAEAGALLLEALEERDERSAQLARRSLVVVTQADARASATDVQHVVAGYQDLAREVVTIPFDQEMVDGHLRLGGLAAATQHAWLAAGAAVARGL